jgi:hypothetical protein
MKKNTSPTFDGGIISAIFKFKTAKRPFEFHPRACEALLRIITNTGCFCKDRIFDVFNVIPDNLAQT